MYTVTHISLDIAITREFALFPGCVKHGKKQHSVDVFLNTPVTKEFPYSFLRKHQKAERGGGLLNCCHRNAFSYFLKNDLSIVSGYRQTCHSIVIDRYFLKSV
jgi:hypothetical protein